MLKKICMKTTLRTLRILCRLWLSELNGGAGYQRYLAHHRAHHPEASPLSRADWFRREQDRQWNTIRRCC